MNKVPFNIPYMTGKELSYIAESKSKNRLAGDGDFTHQCHRWLEDQTGCAKALLTHSCTAALEMAALLLDIKPGDEVIMPSYTFVSTANSFVLRGGIPVFVDIRQDTLNIDEHLIEAAITSKTKAIVVVHYAGVSCEMDAILSIARQYGLKVVEDAAQGVSAKYKGRALGSIGDLGAYSFHETKNVICGEGGALLVNDSQMAQRSEIIREKGTDRSRFFRGEVDKYTWQDVGSSYLPGEMTAAFLWAQFEDAHQITAQRLKIWNYYNEITAEMESRYLIQRPVVPQSCEHNAHMYYLVLPNHVDRDVTLNKFKINGIYAMFHYVPLHSSPAGKRYGKTSGELHITNYIASRLIRLPLWIGLTESKQDYVIETLAELLS